jgi:hypothetical protein
MAHATHGRGSAAAPPRSLKSLGLADQFSLSDADLNLFYAAVARVVPLPRPILMPPISSSSTASSICRPPRSRPGSARPNSPNCGGRSSTAPTNSAPPARLSKPSITAAPPEPVDPRDRGFGRIEPP